MTAYYNEIDKYAAQWLRELIKAGHIAPGDVDERSISDVIASDLIGYTQCHFFAGIGVWSYSLRQAGWSDDRPVWTGSCPCQPFSDAGKGNEFADERHLWPSWSRLIKECRPVRIFGEQIASKSALAWFDHVATDLESEGYTIGAVDTCSAGFGAPHIRQRLHFIAESGMGDTISNGWERCIVSDVCTEGGGKEGGAAGCASPPPDATNGFWGKPEWILCRDGKSRPVEPGAFPLAYGVTSRVGKLRGYGNAINAQATIEFIAAYMEISA